MLSDYCNTVLSDKTPKVIGHFPYCTKSENVVSGELKLGSILIVNVDNMGFKDLDGDVDNTSARQYSWTVDGEALSSNNTVIIPASSIYLDKVL